LKKLIRNLFVAAALLVGGAAFAAEAGKDYTMLSPARPTNTSKIEVLEFFFYGCSHCFHLHPLLSSWEKSIPKDVELTLVPVVFRDSWEPMARTFYALEALGQLPQLHDPLFQAWNVGKVELSDEAEILNFVTPRGVDRAKFSAAYNSFTMQSKVVRAKQMLRTYAIQSTPTIVVDGKYVINGLSPTDTIRVLNDVIALARKEHSKK
jgi:thiol:disulfide interchange protein DsbA